MTSDYTTEDDDDQLMQENEITALESIYSQDFSYTHHPSTDFAAPLYTGVLSVSVTLPSEEVVVQFVDIPDLILGHLPPVTVQFAMPRGYPSRRGLECGVECVWMNKEELERLERRIGEVWEEERDVILFTLASFLQNEALSYLGITFPLQLKNNYHDPATLRTLLTNHDASVRSQTFATTSFTCVLCMDPKKGTACVRLPSCDHVFCVPCLSSYFGMLIREGMILQVRCPDLDCSRKARVARGEPDEEPRTLTQQELVPIVGPELAERYTRLVIKQRNESDPMVTFCPRLQCQQAVRKDPNNPKLCVCEACGFAFCLFCQRTWHGSAYFCQIKNKAKIVQDWQDAETDEERRMLELRYDAKNIERLLREWEIEQETEQWKKDNTMPCPQCGVHVIKSYGCNHMTCRICQSHFCYLCGSTISAKNPYTHFNTKGTPCYSLLFHGDGEEHDDEDF